MWRAATTIADDSPARGGPPPTNDEKHGRSLERTAAPVLCVDPRFRAVAANRVLTPATRECLRNHMPAVSLSPGIVAGRPTSALHHHPCGCQCEGAHGGDRPGTNAQSLHTAAGLHAMGHSDSDTACAIVATYQQSQEALGEDATLLLSDQQESRGRRKLRYPRGDEGRASRRWRRESRKSPDSSSTPALGRSLTRAP